MRKIKVVVILVQQLQHGFTKNAKVSPNLTVAHLASSLEPHAPPIVWRFAEINHYVGLLSDTNIPCRDHLWPVPGLLIINIHFTQCYARYYPYFTCR